jgi:hypothetical protein
MHTFSSPYTLWKTDRILYVLVHICYTEAKEQSLMYSGNDMKIKAPPSLPPLIYTDQPQGYVAISKGYHYKHYSE